MLRSNIGPITMMAYYTVQAIVFVDILSLRSSVGRDELRGPLQSAFPRDSSQSNLYHTFGDNSHLRGGVPINK